MKIEAGKFYKTRDGRKVGPMDWVDSRFTSIPSAGYWKDDERRSWYENGRITWEGEELPGDIISEWQDTPPTQGPIREVRRREILPGVYGAIYVDGSHAGNMVGLQFFEKSSHAINILTAEQLREAAHLFVQLAEVLEESE